jgi:hypothetical protein
MSDILNRWFAWSEVWALFIPLCVLYFHSRQPSYLRPVIAYLWIALAINLFGDVIGDFKTKFNFPHWLQSNNPLYNIHSIVRFTCFSYFFLLLKQPYFKTIKRILPVISLLFIVIYFGKYADFFYPVHLSGGLLTVEAYLLLIYCMLYYLSQLKADVMLITESPSFWVVTGLCIYVVLNFFVFLFYVPLLDQNQDLSIKMWNVHNAAYIILCLLIGVAFYRSGGSTYKA